MFKLFPKENIFFCNYFHGSKIHLIERPRGIPMPEILPAASANRIEPFSIKSDYYSKKIEEIKSESNKRII